MTGDGPLMRRREVLALGGALLAHALGGCGSSTAPASGDSTGAPAPGYLDERQLSTLRAFVDRMIPADQDPGALVARCAEAIDRLLGAFRAEPPAIYAGAPFSDRGGHPVNHFREFVALDEYESLAWRLAIEGSQGRAALEFNGPVKGLQAIYAEGLARLDALAAEQGFADFASAPAAARDFILNGSDPLVAELIEVGFPDTLDAMYGAPEYGGNHGLAGWGFTGFDGDVQPRGYSDEQVVNADNPGPLDFLLPPSFHVPATRGKRGVRGA